MISSLPQARVLEERDGRGARWIIIECPRCRRQYETTVTTTVTCGHLWKVLDCCGRYAIPPRR